MSFILSEEYKLLVKVAEIVASSLVANLVIEGSREAAKHLVEHPASSEDEEEFVSTLEQVGRGHENGHQPEGAPPRFETNVEAYTVDEGDSVQIGSDVRGHPTPFVRWTFLDENLQLRE